MDFDSEFKKKKIMISCFAFREISLEFRRVFLISRFAKFLRNWRKIWQKHENENFRSHPTYSYSTIKEESQNNLFQTD